MNDVRKMGRVTIPTDTDAVSETLDLLKRRNHRAAKTSESQQWRPDHCRTNSSR